MDGEARSSDRANYSSVFMQRRDLQKGASVAACMAYMKGRKIARPPARACRLSRAYNACA